MTSMRNNTFMMLQIKMFSSKTIKCKLEWLLPTPTTGKLLPCSVAVTQEMLCMDLTELCKAIVVLGQLKGAFSFCPPCSSASRSRTSSPVRAMAAMG